MATTQMMVLNPNRAESERYSCPSCSKSFVRKAHMLRHQQQHATQKPFNCSFCSKSFKRSDVLRAHQFRCKERGDNPVPEGQSKGRKRSSCASCVKLRTRCDQETPCSRCLELGKECIRAPTSHPHPPARRTDPHRPSSRDAIPIAHLLNSPPDDEFGPRFPVPGSLHSPEEDATTVPSPENDSETSHWSDEMEPYDPYVGAPDVGFDSFFDGLEQMTFGSSVMSSDPMAMQPIHMVITDSRVQALEPRAQEIRQSLQSTAVNFGSSMPETQPLLELGPAISQLTATEVASLVELFFQHYHKHCPIVHKPSFQPTLKPLSLVLGIMALGGMYAPDKARVERMRSLLDVIELYIFSLPGLREEFPFSFDLSQAQDEDALYAQFETMQGAYLIVVAQYFSGNLAAKRRARRQRFTRVLDVARSLKLPSTQHPSFLSIPDQAAFTAWQRQESRIRHFNVMLAFDAAMAIFNNVPPRITFSELDLPLPCEQAVWESGSFAELIGKSMFPRLRIKLLDAFQLLFVPTPDFVAAMEKESWCCWDCMYLIHLLYSHVWRQTFSNPLLRKSPFAIPAPANILEPLKTAIRNWKTLWDSVLSKLSPEQLAGMGFETSSDSYWTLTKYVIQAFDVGNNKESVSGSASVTSGGHHEQTNAAPPSSATTQQASRVQPIYPDPGSANVGMDGAFSNYSQYNSLAAAHGLVPMHNGMTNMNGMGSVQMGMNMNMDAMPVDHQMVMPMVKEEEGVAHASALPPALNLGSTGTYTASSEPVSATATEFGGQVSNAPDFMPLEADCDTQGAHLRKILRRVR